MNTLISKQYIQILCLILLVSTIFGCINPSSNNSTSNSNIKQGIGSVGNSEFDLEPEWYQKSVSNYSSDFNFNGSSAGNSLVLMKIYQYPDNSGYDGDYAINIQKASEWSVSTGTKNIENINIKTIEKSRLSGGETVLFYFFSKNGKYYQVFIDTSGAGVQYFNKNPEIIDRTINTIVKTIH